MRDIDLDELEDNGLYRHQQAYQRALAARDPFYPPELHEQDVRSRFGLDQFRWNSARDEKAVIALAHNRVRNYKMTIDAALQSIIPHYSHNHDNIPVWRMDKLRKEVKKQTEESKC